MLRGLRSLKDGITLFALDIDEFAVVLPVIHECGGRFKHATLAALKHAFEHNAT